MMTGVATATPKEELLGRSSYRVYVAMFVGVYFSAGQQETGNPISLLNCANASRNVFAKAINCKDRQNGSLASALGARWWPQSHPDHGHPRKVAALDPGAVGGLSNSRRSRVM